MTIWNWFKNHRSQIILSLLAGIVLTLAFPKVDQGWLAWFAMVPLFLAIRQMRVKGAFVLGFLFGMAHNLGLVYWTVHTMHVYGNLPVAQAVVVLILLSAYLSIYPGLFVGILSWLRPKPGHMVLVAPALWVGLEIVRAHLFTGFPWALLGYSQYDFLWLVQFADIFGVYGLSFVIVMANAVLASVGLGWLELAWHGVAPSRKTIIVGVSVTAGLMLVLCGYGMLRMGTIDEGMAQAPSSKVAVIQGNIDQAQKWDPRFQVLTTVKYRNLSLSPEVKSADLVIWPETAAPFYFTDDEILSRIVIDGVKTAGTHFLIGSPSYAMEQEVRIHYNSAYLVSPQGQTQGRYDKVHLVPFGEYVPLKSWLPFIDKMVAQVGDFRTGPEGNTLAWDDRQVGTLICYEVIFPELARAMVQNGAHLLVNITNDAWFGRTSAAYQHFSMAVFRSVENRRYLARAANTGISGFVDPCGRILSPTPLYEEAAVIESISLLEVATLYTRWGEWPMGILVFAILALSVGLKFRKQ